MTAKKSLKNLILERQKKTGEAYAAARAHVMRDRATLLDRASTPGAPASPTLAQGVVLKVDALSAWIRILGEPGAATFRTRDVWRVVPGHVVLLRIEKRWQWRTDDYATGRLENEHIDVTKLGLKPLPLDEPEGLNSIVAEFQRCGAPRDRGRRDSRRWHTSMIRATSWGSTSATRSRATSRSSGTFSSGPE